MSRKRSGGPDPWSPLAPLYDLQLRLEKAALSSLASALEIHPENRLLDVGTGTAGMLRTVAALPNRPAHAVGVDRSRRMLDQAPRLPDGWSLLQADATDLPLPDRSFDRASAAYLLHWLEPPERGRVLAELGRVLEPGGLLGVITISPPRVSTERVVRLPLEFAADRFGGVLGGLRSLDPSAEIEAAGFRLRRRTRTGRGYPSLCVVAERL
ncbi:MAG: methyltransferase domain-containing protein [Solirubrobacterales bacterium]